MTRMDSRLAREFRTQRIIFETARDVFDQRKHTWQGNREVLLVQLVRIVEQFIRSDRISIFPPLFYQDELRRRLIVTLNMSRVVQHVWEAVRQENTERLIPIFDRDHPIRSTGEMRTWFTGKPCERTKKSHINVCVYDSTWTASDAFVLDDSEAVAAWVKNDHLGFEVLYVYRGVVRKYRPDFLVRLAVIERNKTGHLEVMNSYHFFQSRGFRCEVKRAKPDSEPLARRFCGRRFVGLAVFLVFRADRLRFGLSGDVLV